MTNEVRERTVHALAGYIELSAAMREFEDAFGAQVLHAAQQLRDTVEERQRLEAEYRNISERIARGGYQSPEQVESDVRAALTMPDISSSNDFTAFPESVETAEEGLDPATKERIIRDFKRIVLPQVHSDTSDTPYSIFEVAYSAYQAEDFSLMEAFTIQYRGEIALAGEDGQPLSRERLMTRLSDYRAAARRLEDRCATLRQEVTEDELRYPEHTRERMQRQQEEFRLAVIEESERLLELRARLESLINWDAD